MTANHKNWTSSKQTKIALWRMGCGHKFGALTKELFSIEIFWERENHFSQFIITRNINHQNKIFIYFFLCAFVCVHTFVVVLVFLLYCFLFAFLFWPLFLPFGFHFILFRERGRERDHEIIWVGRIYKEWGKRKYMIKMLYVKLIKYTKGWLFFTKWLRLSLNTQALINSPK